MLYSQAEKLIKDADVLAFRGSHFFSKLIKLRTLARVSHVGFALRILDRLCVLEAVEGVGVRLFPLDKHLNRGARVDWYQLDDTHYAVSRDKVIRFVLYVWGAEYAKWSQFLRSWGFLSRRIADFWGLSMDMDEGRWFCSELVMAGLRDGGYTGEGYERESAATSPAEIIELPCLRRMGRLDLKERVG